MKSKINSKLFSPVFVFLFLLLTFCLPAATWANTAAATHGGSLGAEPSGLEQVYILHETLGIDMRELAKNDDQRILVEATYEIENTGADRKLDLVFAFGSKSQDFQVWLDEQEIGSQSIDYKYTPKSWETPRNTPWLDSSKLEYEVYAGNNKSQGFSIVLPAGKHRLKARYKAAASYHNSNPLKLWQFAYILAPAREWAGFGGLDVTINLPPDWVAATNPNLERSGDVLTGHFDKIPADALTLTAQAPIPFSYQALNILFHLLWALALFATPIFIVLFGWKKGFKIKLSWLVGIAFSLLWTLLIFGTGLLAATGANYAVPDNQFSSYGYTGIFHIFGSIIAGAAAFLIGIVLWFSTIHLARKKKTEKLS